MTDQNKKLRTLLGKSGMPTHLKAIGILKNNQWPIIVSPYYYDDSSKSVREIDIIAERIFKSTNDYISQHNVAIAVQLFIECKYINQEIIFWFDNLNKSQAVVMLEKETGLRIAYDKPGGYDMGWNEFHYLHQEKVAKLFSANANREDIIYKAIGQSLMARRFHESSNRLVFEKDGHFEYQNIVRTISYPVILCDNFDSLFEIKGDATDYTHHKILTPFLLETYFNIEEASRARGYTLIDVVDINKLDNFLSMLEVEVNEIALAYWYKSIAARRNQ